jgi:actin-related protein
LKIENSNVIHSENVTLENGNSNENTNTSSLNESNNNNDNDNDNNNPQTENKNNLIIEDKDNKQANDKSNIITDNKTGVTGDTNNTQTVETNNIKTTIVDNNNIQVNNANNGQTTNATKEPMANTNNEVNNYNTEKVEEVNRMEKSHVNLKKTTISTMQPFVIRKGATSNYLKGNISYLNEGNDVSLDPERNYSDVIVIHPGSRYLRIGRASDAFPKEIPHCIARDVTPLKINIKNEEQKASPQDSGVTLQIPENENSIDNNNDDNDDENDNHQNSNSEVIGDNNPNEIDNKNGEMDTSEEEHVNKRRKKNNSRHRNNNNNDNFDDENYMFSDKLIITKEYLKELEADIKFRMRLAKMRVTPNAHSQVRQFNIQSIPEIIPDHNDPYKIEWTTANNKEKYFVGLKALRLKKYVKKDEKITNNSKSRYRLFYPIKNGTFNLEDYDNLQVVLGDIERIWNYVINNELGIPKNEYKDYNVVLVIPDIYDKVYVTELISLLLKEMNFKAIIVQQESVCAAFGAGFSMSCIVDIGAQKTSIACIEDGFCIPETRMNLKYGGDDITLLFMALLIHNAFPYSEIDLNLAYDWQLAQELKERFCTVIESDLTCRVYTFYVRVPDKDTRVFSLKVYDEVVMAPMLLFKTHMIDFRNKLHYLVDSKNNYMNERSVEEIVLLDDYIKLQNPTHTNNNTQNSTMDVDTNSECPSPNTASAINLKEEVKSESVTATNHKLNKTNSNMDIDVESIEETKSHDDTNNNDTNHRNVITINDTQDNNEIFEKVSQPLDVAIAQSISTYVTTISEGWEFNGTNSRKEKDIEDRIRKIYSSILVIGGGGMIPGLSKMIEDRVSHWLHVLLPQGILNSAIQHEIKNDGNRSGNAATEDKRKSTNKKTNIRGVTNRKGPNGVNVNSGNGTAIISPTVITSPRDIDSRVLTWKGASILCKLDCASEMWLGGKEWENGGIKGCYKWLFHWE